MQDLRITTDLNYTISTIKDGAKFQTLVFDENVKNHLSDDYEVLEKYTDTEAEAVKFHKKMIKKYSATAEMIKLAEDLEAVKAKIESRKDEILSIEDGGACNFDSVLFTLNKRNKRPFIKAFNRFSEIKISLIDYGFYKGEIAPLLPTFGQADRNTKTAEMHREELNKLGYNTYMYCQLD